jgi:hypothetical protein
MIFSFEVVKESYPSIWMHVDAAWAGVALACPEYRETAQLAGINEYADSVCTNFHKVTRPNKYPFSSTTQSNPPGT